METGYLQSTGRLSNIVWVDKLLPLGISSWMNDAEPVAEEFKFGTMAIPAYICKKCKLLLGDYATNNSEHLTKHITVSKKPPDKSREVF